MTTIAVGVDLSDESEAAAQWAAASAPHEHLLLVHGYAASMALAPLTEFDIDSTRDATVAHVAGIADLLRAEHPGLEVSTVVEHDFAIPLLTRLSQHVDMLVLGHHRPGLIERLTTGSISAALSARARCPVVTVPYGNLTARGPVVVAVDVDAPSDLALDAAFEFARTTGHPISVICAIPDAATPARIADIYARAEAVVEPWRRRFPECTATLQLVNGAPHRAVVRAVPQASLLVVTRPRGGTSFPVWGNSVTRAAHGASSCPIAVVDHSS
ncbi:universal stress protein [Gordonia jinghuaiqii]|uniref:Universal stress protein n=1 Tax=Gordonia jinghuaiqii TaxID=2758710 RepID=A0A7D7QGX5_9ACTN|nr:universal stress protein [Gordonia jinghuaiqii]MCR5977450.1 universal stress protein [Gordonia jinghuaiqii]QMT02142.1 universal stress protein [Gordonia jinghuaiqii]